MLYLNFIKCYSVLCVHKMTHNTQWGKYNFAIKFTNGPQDSEIRARVSGLNPFLDRFPQPIRHSSNFCCYIHKFVYLIFTNVI